MSLLDAMLLDPAPFECFVAYRTDGVAGSGTLNDPFNAATKWATALPITVLTNSGKVALATVPGHTFVNGDMVTIAGVDAEGANEWNGTFAIYGGFNYYMTGIPMPPDTPLGTAAKVIRFRFDDVLAAVPSNCRVHLGPTAPAQPYLTAATRMPGAGCSSPRQECGLAAREWMLRRSSLSPQI